MMRISALMILASASSAALAVDVVEVEEAPVEVVEAGGEAPVEAATPECPDDPAPLITELRAEGSPFAYDCLAGREDGQSLLIAAAEEGGDFNERVTRALAVWRMNRMEGEISDDEARSYLPPDVRLLTDAIKAFRGRETAAPAHKAVLEKFDWYSPTPSFTDARLTELDRANIEKLLNPPEKVEIFDEGLLEGEMGVVPPAERRERACSCASGTSPGGSLGWLALLGGLTLYRGRGPRARKS